jgi:hypothetical protein
MDPFTAISLAGNILQFIDFTAKVVAHGCEIGQAGGTAEVLDLANVTRDFETLTRKLKCSLRESDNVQTCLNEHDQVRQSKQNFPSPTERQVPRCLRTSQTVVPLWPKN